MNYSTHIFIGKEFDGIIPSIGKSLYTLNSEVVNSNSFYRVESSNGNELSFTRLIIEPVKEVTMKLSGDDIALTWSPEAIKVPDELSAYYRNTIFADINQASVSANSLHLFFHFPFYKTDSIHVMRTLCEAIKGTALSTEIDFIGYCDDMVHLIEPEYKIESSAAKNVFIFKQLREELGLNTASSHLLTIENKNIVGFPLIIQPTENNTAEEKVQIEERAAKSFADMIAQLIYLLSSFYEQIFPRTIEQNDVTGVGFSSLCFDKYLFANYLLRRSILRTMDEESVNQATVDINKPMVIVNDLLKHKKTILSEFFSKYKGKEDKAQYDDLQTEIEGLLENLKLQYADKKNLPDKVAVLAVLLSKSECELFASSVFNINNHCYNDLYGEAIDYFIGEDRTKYYNLTEDEIVFNPLTELKEINRKSINSEAHIRDLEKNIAELGTQIELNERVQDCFVDDKGYYNWGNHKYRLLPNVDEPPLAETYEAKDIVSPSVDLTSLFSRVKDQGQQGSCLSFTLTSIFEYMLHVSKAEDCDLSEAFLYYNARNIDNTGDVDTTVDTGSRFHPAIDSLRKFGIALEKFCPYNEGVYDQRPSDEAYADAEKRKLMKALNVKITLNDFKSALSEGYPIATSFTLYDSFDQARSNGFVPLPTSEEIAQANISEREDTRDRHSRHAMVIVGYSDQLQMFLVRNSWGEDWGDKGYCYIPYGYIEQAGLVNFACIITEVASIASISPELRQVPAMKIDNADLYIRYYVSLAALQQEQSNIAQYKTRRLECLNYFEQLKMRYVNANSRDQFISRNVELLGEDKKQQQSRRDEAQLNREKIKEEYTKNISRQLIFAAIFALVCFLFFKGGNTILNKFVYPTVDKVVTGFEDAKEKATILADSFTSDTDSVVVAKPVEKKEIKVAKKKDRFRFKYIWLLPIYLVYFIVMCVKCHRLWKDWREQRDELDFTIEDCNKNIDDITLHIGQFRHKAFASWQTIKSLDDVQRKLEELYCKYTSLLNNLRLWYKQIQEANEDVCMESSFPNITILDKSLLDTYFEEKLSKTTICDIPLSKNIEQYEISGEYLSKYQINIHNILFNRLKESIDFNMSVHIVEDGKYCDIALPVTSDYFSRLDRQSEIFMQIDTSSSSRRGVVTNNVMVLSSKMNVYGNGLAQKMRPLIATTIDSDDQYRLMFVKTATYSYDECVALRSINAKK